MYLSKSFQGNVHEAVQFVDKLKCRNALFQIVPFNSPYSSCILIFKVTSREDEAMARKELGLVDIT